MNKSNNLKIRTSKLSGKPRPTALISIALYPPYTGGGPTYFSTLVDQLKEKVDFIILTQSCKDAKIIDKQDNVFIYRLQPYLQWYPAVMKYLFIVPITLLAMLYFWVRYRPVIHAHSSGIYGFVIGLFSLMFQADMLKEVQDLRDPGYNLKFGKVKKYIACGGAVEDKLKSLGIPDDQIIKYPAINPPSVEQIFSEITTEGSEMPKIESRPEKKGTKLLFVGWLDSIDKGVDVLLEAFKIASLEKEDISLSLIGDGPDRQYCERFILENDLKNINILGRLDYSSTMEHIDESDIIVLPSKLEAQGRAIIEGYQFSKPAIGTKVGGIPELIEHGKTGLLVEPEQPNELAKAILKLANDPKLRQELGKNGFEFLKTMPTWQDLADDIYKEYIDIWQR
jgi:glycosyltransferase involved in cell wall biosynthesis